MAVTVVVRAGPCGPGCRRPSARVPSQYKEAGWKVGEPLDAIDRGAWWSVYQDPVLDDLEKQIDKSNQNLKAAEAAFRQAQWIVAQARAGYFPTGTVNSERSAFAHRRWCRRRDHQQFFQHVGCGELDAGSLGANSPPCRKGRRERPAARPPS